MEMKERVVEEANGRFKIRSPKSDGRNGIGGGEPRAVFSLMYEIRKWWAEADWV